MKKKTQWNTKVQKTPTEYEKKQWNTKVQKDSNRI